MTELERRRQEMLDMHLAGRTITAPQVLGAFASVPREAFVPWEHWELAYDDSALSIGYGQTISQPYVAALTLQALGLRGGECVLEVGAGSGYAAALLGRIVRSVYAVERVAPLAQAASDRLARLGFDNVHVMRGDGSLGWPEHAPYDAIVVSACGPKPPDALLAQLAMGGRLVIPVGQSDGPQVLLRIARESVTEYRQESLTEVRFVPLIGAQGWAEPDARERNRIHRGRSTAGPSR